MPFHDLILGMILCVTVALNWVRARSAPQLRARRLYSRAFLCGLVASASASFLATLSTDTPVILIWIAPFVLMTALSHNLDPVHKSSPRRTRLLVLLVPASMTLTALLMDNAFTLAFMSGGPIALGTLVFIVLTLGGYVAWKDFRNIAGMNPDEESWVAIDDSKDDVRPPRVQFSDDEIWTRIILVCLLIVLLMGLALSLTAASTLDIASLWPFFPGTVAILLAWTAMRIPRHVGALRVGSRVYGLSILATVFSATSIILSSAFMNNQSDLGSLAMLHRWTIGILVGSMWTEGFIASFFLINCIPLQTREWLYALASGLGWAAILVAASTVRYFSHGVFRLGWVATNGLLLLMAYISSVMAWRAIGKQIPRSRLLTLKTPEDIALSDNTMFAGLAGACVAGLSLVTNGESPLVAVAVMLLVITFVSFAIGNDKEHLRNEKTRLKGENAPPGRSIQDCNTSLRRLRTHLRLQEAIPTIAVIGSFLWAVVLWFA